MTYPNQLVKELRKSGRLEEALQAGSEAFKNNPQDIWLARELSWVYYEYIKGATAAVSGALDAKRKPRQADFDQLLDFSRRFAQLKLPRTDFCFSHIIRVLTDIGRHVEHYLLFVSWSGLESFRDEDYKPYEGERGTSASLVTKVALELLAWIDARPDQVHSHADFILNSVAKALENRAEPDAKKIWLFYGRAKLLLRLQQVNEAAVDTRRVLREKRNEFWAWSWMAEVELQRAPRLATACFCQAMLCRPDPNFTGKLQLKLADLLLNEGEVADAIGEYLQVAKVYQENGWKFPEELDAAMQASWFDSSLAKSHKDREGFYRSRADEALRLLYDDVVERPATYLGERDFRDSGKTRSLFAFREKDESTQLLARWPGRRPKGLMPGAPVLLTLGMEGKRSHLLQAAERTSGEHWDALDVQEGVVENISGDGARGGIYFGPNLTAVLVTPPDQKNSLLVGEPVRAWMANNPGRGGRRETCRVEKLKELPDIEGLNTQVGEFRRTPKGFGFVDDVFVPPPLADAEMDGKMVTVMAVYGLDKSKGVNSWKAVRMTLADAGIEPVFILE